MAFAEHTLYVNGIKVDAVYNEETVKSLFLPFLEKLTALRREKGGRVIAFLAAPPGAGKSTLSLFLENLSRGTPGLIPLQALGIDGFHRPQEYLLSHSGVVYGENVRLAEVKGAPETYDTDKLAMKLRLLAEGGAVPWPVYDRQIHDVIDDKAEASGGIILLEGNWLLLRDGAWSGLKKYADISLFVYADEPILRGRLVSRKIAGGLTQEQAEAFYRRTDGKNVIRALTDSVPADISWTLLPDGDYTYKQ